MLSTFHINNLRARTRARDGRINQQRFAPDAAHRGMEMQSIYGVVMMELGVTQFTRSQNTHTHNLSKRQRIIPCGTATRTRDTITIINVMR